MPTMTGFESNDIEIELFCRIQALFFNINNSKAHATFALCLVTHRKEDIAIHESENIEAIYHLAMPSP
jgi:hypothetical protein